MPTKSPPGWEPGFLGVTVLVRRQLVNNENCQLLLLPQYSPGLSPQAPRPGAAHSLPTPPSLDLGGFSSSDEDLPLCDIQGKCCASCNTRKTPLWRDAEDGTPLCNACGIRYKKYRVRCAQCWHIPKKDGNSFLRCLKCGNFLRLSLYQRKNGHR